MLTNKCWEEEFAQNNENITEHELTFNIDDFNRCINMEIYDMHDCLTLSNRGIEISAKQFDAILKEYPLGRVGYEVYNNEFRVIDFVSQNLSIRAQWQFGRMYVQYLNSRLTLIKDRKIYYILSINDDILTIRFHQEWEEEIHYFSNIDINDRSEPIAIITSSELPINFLRLN
ncbi:hypothetical protein [Enterococcus sp. LJL51]|uniref:hypothetical protein n=1 Tax=Enterococcus sp. LJL51 TaxID=3416656 RepID=UPI003CE9D92B